MFHRDPCPDLLKVQPDKHSFSMQIRIVQTIPTKIFSEGLYTAPMHSPFSVEVVLQPSFIRGCAKPHNNPITDLVVHIPFQRCCAQPHTTPISCPLPHTSPMEWYLKNMTFLCKWKHFMEFLATNTERV